jgi:hypothetical protein
MIDKSARQTTLQRSSSIAGPFKSVQISWNSWDTNHVDKLQQTDKLGRAIHLHLQSRYHSHAVILTDLTIDAAHAGNTHDQIVSQTFETFIRHGKETKHRSVDSLFLLGVGLLGLRLGALLADTDKAGLRASVTELPVSILLALVVGNGTLLE